MDKAKTNEKVWIEKIEPLCRGRRYEFASVILGSTRGRLVKDLLIHPGAVVILPLIDDDNVLLLRQYRVGADSWIYELPAGTIEKGEKPEETARRELEEETGYIPGELRLLFKMYPSPGVSTEVMYMFKASRLKQGRPRPERDEFIETSIVSLVEAIDMIKRGVIVDGKTIALLLYYYAFHYKSLH